MPLLNVGEMAKANGVSVKTLHLYQDKGILEPAEVDEATGYRRYSIVQSTRLDMVSELRNVGFTLDEIAAISQEGSIDYLRERAVWRRQEIHDQIARLQAEADAVDALVCNCTAFLERTVCNRIVIERIPERRIILFDAPTLDDLGGCDPSVTDYERWMWRGRYVKQQLVSLGIDTSLYRNVSSCISLDALRSGAESTYFDRPCLFVGASFAQYPERTMWLQGGCHLVVYMDVCHNDDGSELETHWSRRLLEYADQEGLEVMGPLVIESIMPYRIFFDSNAHGFYRYCLPVRRSSM